MALLSVSGESLQAVADAIREKGGTSEQLEFPDGFTEAIANIETGGGGEPVKSNDVNFVDYDGTIIYSYSKEDFLSLTALPENPNHESEGLVSKGWNWSLEDAKTFMSKSEFMDIGQEYETDDETTRIYIHISNVQKHMQLSLSVPTNDGSSHVHWGDGTIDEIQNATTLVHDYSSIGDYIIKIENPTQDVTMGYSTSLFGLDLTQAANRAYKNIVRKMELGKRIVFTSNSIFRYLSKLESIILHKDISYSSRYDRTFEEAASLRYLVIPKGMNTNFFGQYAFSRAASLTGISYSSDGFDVYQYAFNYCSSLIRFSFSKNTGVIARNAFYYCMSLRRLCFSDGVTSIESYCFQNCYSINELVIPATVKNIASSAFSNCSYTNEIHMESNTPPTLSSQSTSLPTVCYIYVPSGAVERYKSAWSNLASRIMAEPE